MTPKELTKISKKLSYYLRHKPEEAGLVLDAQGWTSVESILAALNITRAQLDEVVAENNKKRFEIKSVEPTIFDIEHTPQARGPNYFDIIRASQGHSVDVELGYVAQLPPSRLYHGTHAGIVDTLLREGIQKMDRHHVHLSADMETARGVGQRRGKPVVLVVHADEMVAAGHAFFLSTNGVWLVDSVPPSFIEWLDESPA